MPSFITEIGSPNQNGLCPVRVLITVPNKAKKTSERKRGKLFFSIPKKDWNPRTRRVKDSHPECSAYNKRIVDKMHELETAYAQSSGKLTASQLQAIVESKYQGNDIASQLKAYGEARINAGRIGTGLAYCSASKTIAVQMPGLTLDDLTIDVIEEFEKRMRVQGYSHNYTAMLLSKVQRLCTLSVKSGAIKSNPFAQYTIRTVKTKKSVLNKSEIKSVESGDSDQCNDIVLLAYYLGGARVGDVVRRLKTDIYEDTDESGSRYKRIHYYAQKTGKYVNRKISDKALEIIERYPEGLYLFPIANDIVLSGDPVDDYKLWRSATRDVCTGFQKAALASGITKHVNTHTARHSAANAIRKEFKDPYRVKEMLGHEDLKTTQDYLQELAIEEMDEATDSL